MLVTSWWKNNQGTTYVLNRETIYRKGNGSINFIERFTRNQDRSMQRWCNSKRVLREKDCASFLFPWTYSYSQLLFLDFKITCRAWLSSIWNRTLGHFLYTYSKSWWIRYVSWTSELRYWTWKRSKSLIALKKRVRILRFNRISLLLWFCKTHSTTITLISRVAQDWYLKDICSWAFFRWNNSYQSCSFRQKNRCMHDIWPLVLCLCSRNFWRVFKT